MLVGVFILALFSWTNADNGNGTDPHCDLVAVSHVDIQQNGNGTLTIDFSWDRKLDNYKTIGTPLRMYVVRHGPIVDGELANTSEIMEIPFPEKDALTLKNVKPYANYGIQVCAVTTSYRFLFQNDIWDRAWIGTMDLSTYGTPLDQSALNADIPTTPKSDAKSYKPQCDLVQTSYVTVDETSKTSLVVYFSWDKKLTSYDSIGPINHYIVRYGPESKWGGKIEQETVHFMTISNDTTSIALNDVPRGSYYAIQICAVAGNSDGKDIDWDNDAWLGGMDFTTYSAYAANIEDSRGASDDNMTQPENITFVPQCDLVGSSYVEIDDSEQALTITFGWDTKQASYQSTGPVDGYEVRYGRQNSWGSGIEDSDEHYLVIGNDTTSVTLSDVPRGVYYGIQICAQTGMNDPDINWKTDAWLGTMDLTSIGTDDDTETSMVQQMSNHVSEIPDHPQSVVFHSALGTDYTVLLAVLTAITIIFIIVACAWVTIWRKRRVAKLHPLYFDPVTKQGSVFP